MPDPIDSYRVGGNGLVHFYSGGQPVLSAHASSPMVADKIRSLDAARGGAADSERSLRDYWRPVVDATTAEPKPAFPSFSAPSIRPGHRMIGAGELDAASRMMAPPVRPPTNADKMAMTEIARGLPPPGLGPPPMPPQGAPTPPPQGVGGGPPIPPMPPPTAGATPMGAPPVPMSALDEAYQRQMMDTGARFR